MKNLKAILVSVVAVLMVSCGTTRTVPLTGRQQNLMVEDGQILSLATQQYQEFMKTAKLSTNAANTAMVKRVGQNLANAVVNYLNTAGLSSEVANYKWTFNLVQDKQVNAWCMPGGLICVYEGLLPVTQDEASLAIVLGHEIAHAVARHSAEQMSTQIKQQYGLQIGAALLGQVGMGANTSSIIQAIAAQGFNFKNLKYSRNHENEADHMGLIFAAMAGYDPRVATTFWQRMAASKTTQTAEFLSDHPSDATRIKNIQGWMPEALRYYNPKVASTVPTAKTTKTAKTLKVSSSKK
ncbi:M48 family metallopeptidase [Prevotella sp. lc2012]|uniref:M48 family metallopeptidase n=1 Tax=Prevotella sp. lc2012 TaxID=1761886 RepID=UPI00089B2759|nr:M48 family metallopeptidase [Prevotella sp. lc2012]SEE39019.1 Peptidase family M48 [Prevotella sp. lc2012]